MIAHPLLILNAVRTHGLVLCDTVQEAVHDIKRSLLDGRVGGGKDSLAGGAHLLIAGNSKVRGEKCNVAIADLGRVGDAQGIPDNAEGHVHIQALEQRKGAASVPKGTLIGICANHKLDQLFALFVERFCNVFLALSAG